MRIRRRLAQGLIVGASALLVLAGCRTSEETEDSTNIDETSQSQEGPESAEGVEVQNDSDIGPANVIFGQIGGCGGNGYFQAEKLDKTSVRVSAQATNNCDAITEVEFVLSQVDDHVVLSSSGWLNWSAHNERDDAPVQAFASILLNSFDLDGVISGTIDGHITFWTKVGQNPRAGPTQLGGSTKIPEEPVTLLTGQTVWADHDCIITLLDNDGNKSSLLRSGLCPTPIVTEILEHGPAGTRIRLTQNSE